MKLKVAVPWILAQCGLRKWLTERALRLPEAWLPTVCSVAGVTPKQWRAMEATLVRLVYDGLVKTEDVPRGMP